MSLLWDGAFWRPLIGWQQPNHTEGQGGMLTQGGWVDSNVSGTPCVQNFVYIDMCVSKPQLKIQSSFCQLCNCIQEIFSSRFYSFYILALGKCSDSLFNDLYNHTPASLRLVFQYDGKLKHVLALKIWCMCNNTNGSFQDYRDSEDKSLYFIRNKTKIQNIWMDEGWWTFLPNYWPSHDSIYEYETYWSVSVKFETCVTLILFCKSKFVMYNFFHPHANITNVLWLCHSTVQCWCLRTIHNFGLKCPLDIRRYMLIVFLFVCLLFCFVCLFLQKQFVCCVKALIQFTSKLSLYIRR